MEKPPFKSFGNTEYGAYYAMARLSRERAASHHHSTIGHRQAKAQGNGKDQKRHAPKEVKTSKKAPSSNPLGSHSSYFPLAIPHSFPFRSVPFQLCNSRNAGNTLNSFWEFHTS